MANYGYKKIINNLKNFFNKDIENKDIEEDYKDRPLSEIYEIQKMKMKFKQEKDEQEFNKQKREFKLGLSIIIIALFVLLLEVEISSLLSPKNPTLKNYNSLSLGMSYKKCKSKLGVDGHLILEENNKTTYVWYDVNCNEENCPIVIKLDFENDKLIRRVENGLK